MNPLRTLVAASLLLGAPAWAANVTTAIPVTADNVIMEAHRSSNDGSWGYGWIKVTQGAHNYGLLRFDISALQGLQPAEIVSVHLKLRVAQNHFASKGKWYDVHPIDSSAPAVLRNWVEGGDSWDRFGYCSRRNWARPAKPLGDEGSTWVCANDPGVRDGKKTCTTLDHFWEPEENFVQSAFRPTASASSFQTRRSQTPATDCPGLTVGGDDCNPSCRESIGCIDAGGTPDQCYRTVSLDVTADVETFLGESFFQPSWLIKRQDNSGSGAVHYLSREGAVCILGECGTVDRYKTLRPILEVVTTRPLDHPVVEPPMHCEALC